MCNVYIHVGTITPHLQCNQDIPKSIDNMANDISFRIPRKTQQNFISYMLYNMPNDLAILHGTNCKISYTYNMSIHVKASLNLEGNEDLLGSIPHCAIEYQPAQPPTSPSRRHPLPSLAPQHLPSPPPFRPPSLLSSFLCLSEPREREKEFG